MWSFEISHKAFHQQTVIENFTFRLDEGHALALVGPSGAGKTTLLNIIAGLDQQFTGTITCSLTQPRIAMMFQEARLMPWLTVIDNVLVGSAQRQREHYEQARTLLAMLGLAAYETAFPVHLSGGMQKRVSLARAFIHQPHLLLMDEPFSSLDVAAADDMRCQLATLMKDFATSVIYVTHDIREALCIADRLLLTDKAPLHIVKEIENPLPRPLPLFNEDVNVISAALQRDYAGLLGTTHAQLTC